MKILKQADGYGIFPLKIECRRVVDEYGFSYGNENDFCGSILEIEVDDIRKHPWFKYPTYEGVDYGVVCPVCGKFIVIDESILPVGVKNLAYKIRLNSQ